MIYLEETLNLSPASPETLDQLIDFAREKLLPLCERLGSRPIAAWYSDVEFFCQVTHVFEFDDLAAFDRFRTDSREDREWGDLTVRLDELAPERRTRLLEPLGPVRPEILHEAIALSGESPLGAYSIAMLEVAPGKMPDFIAGLEVTAGSLPIIASWRPVTGKNNEVIDVWKNALRQEGYQPADDMMKEFFRQLRMIAPKERLVPVYTLPYSKLR
jgi:hypothetical protein